MLQAAREISTASSWRTCARKEDRSKSGTQQLYANDFRATLRNNHQRVSGTKDTWRLAVIVSFAVFAALAPSDKTLVVRAEATASAVQSMVGNLTGENLNPPLPSPPLCRWDRISSLLSINIFSSPGWCNRKGAQVDGIASLRRRKPYGL